MNVSARNLRQYHNPDLEISEQAFMGGYHFVTTFDLMQHGPVRSLPLYTFSTATGRTLMTLAADSTHPDLQVQASFLFLV